jgi:hypothetical protein
VANGERTSVALRLLGRLRDVEAVLKPCGHLADTQGPSCPREGPRRTMRRVVTNCTHTVPLMRGFKLLSSPPESGLAAKTRKRVSGPEQGGRPGTAHCVARLSPPRSSNPLAASLKIALSLSHNPWVSRAAAPGATGPPAAARATCRLVWHDLENTRHYGSASAHLLLAVTRNAGSHIARGVPARPTVCMVQVLPQQGPAASRGSLATACAAGGSWQSPPGRYLGGLFKV